MDHSKYANKIVLWSFNPEQYLIQTREQTKGMGMMADALLPASPLVLPRCKTLWSPSLGTTCWRWDWAELLLFAPLAPGFHKSLFLTLKEWCRLQVQSGLEEVSTGISGKVIYTWKRGEGSKDVPVHTHLKKSHCLHTLPWRCAELL